MKRVLVAMVSALLSVMVPFMAFADDAPESPSFHYDGRKMVGEMEPVLTETSDFDIVIVRDAGDITIPQHLDAEAPLNASYLLGQQLWQYAPGPGLIMDGLYTDRDCTCKFQWGTAVKPLKQLFLRFKSR